MGGWVGGRVSGATARGEDGKRTRGGGAGWQGDREGE